MGKQELYSDKLESRGINPTAVRVLVLKTLMSVENALSMSDIEELLPTLEKSSVFRALNLFLEHKLVHTIDDGTGALKYAVCSDGCECTLEEEHVHFYCEKCGKTFCFAGLHIPALQLPKGFVSSSANFVFKGVCSNCSVKEESK